VRILGVVLLFVVSARVGMAQGGAADVVPPQLTPPAGTHLVLQARGTGDQVYTCVKQDSGYAWTLKAPDARLLDATGVVIGRHFAGPSWQLNDSSRITGKAVAHVDAPEPTAIAWLLVTVVSESGDGRLRNVSAVQRLRTNGGKAPASGCDAAHLAAEVRAPYSADYLFYGR
jgi:hypothetical protein